MKFIKPSTIAASALLTFAMTATAQQATETGQISATVEFQDITLAQVDPMSFGTLLPFGRQGFIYVNQNGTTSASNALSTLAGSPGSWDVTGVANAPYDIVFPANVTLTSGDGNTMTVDQFHRTGGGSQLYLDAAGQASFKVGGRLIVGANQPAGSYAGEYQVTVSYN